MNNGFSAYNQINVTTADPMKVILMLYDGAIRFLKEAIECTRTGDIKNKNINANNARDIIVELNNALNVEVGGEMAHNLRSLYLFMNRHLMTANWRNDVGAMTEVLEQMNRRIKTVAVAEILDESLLLSPEEFKGAHDPHVWFDVSLWRQVTEGIAQTLVLVDSAGKDYYENRAADYLKQLEELHAYVTAQTERVPEEKRVLITAHDAFNYFGRAYGFEVRGLQGISTAAEAGTGDVQSLVNFIVKRKIPAMFVESSVPPRNIEAVQAAVKSRAFNVQIGGELFSDAMGTKATPEGTYIGMVKHNIDTIVRALLGEKGTEEEQ